MQLQVDLSESRQLFAGQLCYFPNFLAGSADTLYQQLEQSLDWQQGHIKMFGKVIAIPRLQAWYGDDQAFYRYSGVTMHPLPWTPLLWQLKELCEQTCRAPFNSTLANYYRHQQDSMGWHSDNEKELGSAPVIASLSFGQARRFCLKHKSSGERFEILLQSGSLLIMQGQLQQQWQHALPKSSKAMQGRINLTYRYVFPR
ncbi:alpha-ketoglutarate-dependent dioxygenase AlkB [Thalassotalea maritima]|uniref:alpha-ketoglutarate-dependent dioxygenase AlkB family protein n=1 Tax=Thalassotalea maritima TaxID=3242416 RepID=UPI0035270558